MQAFISALARKTGYIERHGEVVAVRSHEGATFHAGGYLSTRLYATTFADGTVLTFHLVAGVPTQVARECATQRCAKAGCANAALPAKPYCYIHGKSEIAKLFTQFKKRQAAMKGTK